MRKFIVIFLIIAGILLIFSALSKKKPMQNGQGEIIGSAAQAKDHRLLYTKGTKIMSGNTPLLLKGVNVEGWLMWQANIWGGGFVAESTMSARLTDLAGADAFGTFQQAIYDHFITEDDIAQIATDGFNVIRVPIHYRFFERPDSWKRLNNLIDWCRQHHVYIVLDLHAVPGGSSRVYVADPGKTLIWSSPENKQQTIDLWKEIANRYKDEPMIAGYEFINEPAPDTKQELLDLYHILAQTIRDAGDYHILFIQGTDFSTDFSFFTTPIDDNSVYAFHLYSLLGPDKKEKIVSSLVAQAKKQDIPLWCGEFGANTLEWTRDAVGLFAAHEDVIAGWAFWNWKRVPSTNEEKYVALVEITPPDSWKSVMDWVSWPYFPNKEPSRETVTDALSSFPQAVQLEHSIVNTATQSVLQEK